MCGVNDREAFCEEAMTDESRKRLTEYLEECRHDWRFPYTGSDMGCFKCKQFKSTVTDRTFTTGNDMMDLKNKIVEKGEGEEFIKFSYMKWVYPETQVKINPATILAIRSSAGFDLWLINPSIFIPLVDEWLKEKEKSHESASD